MSLTTEQKGTLAALKVQLRAVEKNCIVSVPLVQARYDFVIDDGKKLWRTQVKYGGDKDKRTGGSVAIRLRKCNDNRTLLYSEDEVDLVLAYLPDVDKIVRLLPEHFHMKNGFVIRLERPKRNKACKYHWFEDFIW